MTEPSKVMRALESADRGAIQSAPSGPTSIGGMGTPAEGRALVI